MAAETTPVATVTGLYRGTAGGLEPLTKDTPLTQDEVRRNPVFYELELAEDTEDADLIIDISLRQHGTRSGCRTSSGAPTSRGGSGSGRTGSRSRRTGRCGT